MKQSDDRNRADHHNSPRLVLLQDTISRWWSFGPLHCLTSSIRTQSATVEQKCQKMLLLVYSAVSAWPLGKTWNSKRCCFFTMSSVLGRWVRPSNVKDTGFQQQATLSRKLGRRQQNWQRMNATTKTQSVSSKTHRYDANKATFSAMKSAYLCHQGAGQINILVKSTHWSNQHTGEINTLVRSKHWSNRNTGQINVLVKSTHW